MINVLSRYTNDILRCESVDDLRETLTAEADVTYRDEIGRLCDALAQGKPTLEFEKGLGIDIMTDGDLRVYEYFTALLDNEDHEMTRGELKAYHAWYWRKDKGFMTDELVMDDFCWDYEVADFIKALREAGIESFIVTNSSSGLMENIHGYVREGARMAGLCEVDKRNLWRTERVQGIRFEL